MAVTIRTGPESPAKIVIGTLWPMRICRRTACGHPTLPVVLEDSVMAVWLAGDTRRGEPSFPALHEAACSAVGPADELAAGACFRALSHPLPCSPPARVHASAQNACWG